MRIKDSIFYRTRAAARWAQRRYHYDFLREPMFPETIHIENTNACNAECIMCPREKMDRRIGIMDMKLYERLVKECAGRWQLREFHLHGFGESLVDKSLHDRIALAKDHGMRNTYIVTTGSLMDEEVSRRLVLSGLDKIKISFYGATKESYEAIHFRLSFEEALKNVRGLFRVRDELGALNPQIIIQFLPMKENEGERELFSAMWKPFIDKTRGDCLTGFELHNYTDGRAYNEVRKDNRRSCPLPFTTMHILWNGDVVPCCFDYNGNAVLTNVRERSVEEAWNDLVLQRLRQAHKLLELSEFPICDDCDQIVIR